MSTGTSLAAIVLMLGMVGVVWSQWRPNSGYDQEAETPVTDVMIMDAIKGSDDLDRHQAAFIGASRLFMEKGGTLSDLREMGGWVRSQRHKPRHVYFTYRQPGNVANRWYFDVDSGRLFQ